MTGEPDMAEKLMLELEHRIAQEIEQIADPLMRTILLGMLSREDEGDLLGEVTRLLNGADHLGNGRIDQLPVTSSDLNSLASALAAVTTSDVRVMASGDEDALDEKEGAHASERLEGF